MHTLPSKSAFTHTARAQMQAARAAVRYAPEEEPFSVRRRPRSGAPLCPACDAAVGPLAIMGVRLRVRHQSLRRAQGTETNPVLPELSLTTAFPITLLSVSRRGSSQACT